MSLPEIWKTQLKFLTVKKGSKIALCALSSLFLTGCQAPKIDGSSKIEQKQASIPAPFSAAASKEERRKDRKEIEKYWQALPPSLKENLAQDIASLCDRWEKKERLHAIASFLAQAGEGEFPMAVGASLPLKLESRYDGKRVNYTFFCPNQPEQAQGLVICLAEAGASWVKELEDLPLFAVQIPSRERMSYQLIAEGDFWQCLTTLFNLYPELKELPVYLASDASFADAALLLANNYRYRFNGLMINGGRLGATLPNLDDLPIVYYSEDAQQDSLHRYLFSGPRLIERLQARGNERAAYVEGPLSTAIETLLQFNQPLKKGSFAFEDYRYAQAWSWLKVASKKNEEEPALIAYEMNNRELSIASSNVSSIELNTLNYPGTIKQLRFNDRLITAKKGSLMRIGEEDLPEYTAKKSDLPPSLHNFFSLEPLYIVFQNKGEHSDYLIQVKKTALKFASLAFSGFPNLEVELPLIPLDQYEPQKLPLHRAIFIGQEAVVRPYLEMDSDYLPLHRQREKLFLGQRLLMDKATSSQIAYGIQFPPEKEGTLQLALMLVAEEGEGLKALAEHYLSPANLYRQMDLCLFAKQEAKYRLATIRNFDSYFGCCQIPEPVIELPKTNALGWELFLRQLLSNQYQTPFLAVGNLVADQRTPPSHVSLAEILKFVYKKNFIKVTVNLEAKETLEKFCLLSLSPQDKASLKSLLEEGKDSELKLERCRRSCELLVDADKLLALPTHLLSSLHLQMMPYDAVELCLKAFKQNGLQSGQQILRLSQKESVNP